MTTLCRFPVPTAVLALVLAAPCLLRPSDFQPRSARFTWSMGDAEPNVNLPKHILAPQGQLTLFADYAAAGKTGVPLFLVNRTQAPVTLACQGREAYTKLEYQDSGGAWRRAQAHTFSFCGNSYEAVTLGSGRHFRFYGYRPRDGVRGRIRYRSYGARNLVSNEGIGFFSLRDVEDSECDGLSAAGSPGPLNALLFEGCELAGPFPAMFSKRVAAVRLLSALGGSPCARRAAVRLMAGWAGGPGTDAAVAALREVLSASWPRERSSRAVLRRCVLALQRGPGGYRVFGAPEDEPGLCWDVLVDLAERLYGTDKDLPVVSDVVPADWEPAIELARRALDTGASRYTWEALKLVNVPMLADELIPDGFFERHMGSSNRGLRATSIGNLSRRSRYERLVELGWRLSPEGQLSVLLGLAQDNAGAVTGIARARGPAPGSREIKFWAHVMETQTLSAAAMLSSLTGMTSVISDGVVKQPLRSFLMAEAERSDRAREDFDLAEKAGAYRLAVGFLARWQSTEDVPIFTRLLKFRGYELESAPPAGRGRRVFAVREAARQALVRMGR